MVQGVVIRGSTPTHDIELPFPSDCVGDIRITYGQKNKPVFTKTMPDCIFSNNYVSVVLSQEETFQFVPLKNVEIEIRVNFKNGAVTQTEEPITLRVVDSMNTEVMS